MSVDERVRLWLQPFDVLLAEALRYGDTSAWLRTAFEAFLVRLGDSASAPKQEIKMNLLAHHEQLVRGIERLAPNNRGRSLLMRSVAYYWLGRQEQHPIDVGSLADQLLAVMSQRGFEVEKSRLVQPPSDSELAEIMASIGQFHVK